MCMKSHICAILDYFLSPESRFEKWMSLNIILHVFNLPGISLAKKKKVVGLCITSGFLGIILDTVL